MTKLKNITSSEIRALLKIQNGRCAISGEKLKPSETSVDHVIPISRKDLIEEKGYGKFWLVSSKVNKLKGAMTMDDLYLLIEKIITYKKNSKKLEDKVLKDNIEDFSKKDFDKYILENFDEDGVIKDK